MNQAELSGAYSVLTRLRAHLCCSGLDRSSAALVHGSFHPIGRLACCSPKLHLKGPPPRGPFPFQRPCRLRNVLESITVKLIGEVSEVNAKAGYKAVYFTVKDDGASLPCMIWLNRYHQSGVQLCVGQRVELTGRFTLYAPKGRMNFDVFSISLAGEGDLRRRVAELAQRLEREGLMAASRNVLLVAVRAYWFCDLAARRCRARRAQNHSPSFSRCQNIACRRRRRRLPGPAGHRVRNRCVRKGGRPARSFSSCAAAEASKTSCPSTMSDSRVPLQHAPSQSLPVSATSPYVHSRYGRRRQVVDPHCSRRTRFA